MTTHPFTSTFAPQLDSYLSFKRSMGYSGASRVWYLHRFDSYCVQHGHTLFDRATVEGWVLAQAAGAGRYLSWMSYIRDFGRWLQANGCSDAYVLSDRWKAPFVPAHPYLLSGEEIDRFFAAARDLHPRSPWRWQAVAFFALMHSCGLRTGEVRSLLTRHVDLPGQHISIFWGKGNRSRRLPITDQITEVLAGCEKESRRRVPSRRTFFVSATGNPVTAASVGKAFASIWDQAGLSRPVHGTQPRPYDFRHHFAYANIERWRRQGKDVTALLPYLSRYMGHATFDSTFYYVHTSPDFMRAYDDIAINGQALLPEVGFA